MTEVHVVRHDNSHRYRGELEQYFRRRYDVFVRERGWKNLERPDGRDIDQFDTEDAIHLLAIDKHQVIGGVRMNPSMGPTLLSEVFPHLCSIPLTKSPDIYEVTRMWVVKERRSESSRPTVEALLTVASIELSLALGIRKTRALFEMRRLDRNKRLGWTFHPLGLPQQIDGVRNIAVEKDVSEGIWMRACVELSVPGLVLIWNGTTRPPYQLPELPAAVARSVAVGQ